MKKFTVLVLVILLSLSFLIVSLSGCAEEEGESGEGVTITVYNCEDYIDEATLDEFCLWYEEKYGEPINVNYITYDTNETMLTKLMNNDADVDVVCASEYAIQKLLNENLLLPLDKNENMNTINPDIYKRTGNKFGADFENYFVPYMYGTLGILYNADIMEENGIDVEELGWGLLWNKSDEAVLDGKILMKDSIRDTFAAGVLYLKEENALPEKYKDYSPEDLINCTDSELVQKVRQALIDQKSALKGYEVDFGKDDLIAQRAYVDLAWSGDAMYAIEEAELYNVGLDYYVPEVGANVWFDGWFIPTVSKHTKEATAFIEFTCLPTVAMSNMVYVGYSSAVQKDVLMNDEDCLAILEENEYDAEEFFDWEVRYPNIDNPNYGMMTDYGASNEMMTIMWEEVKAATASGSLPMWQISLICLGVIVGLAGILVAIYFVWRHLSFDRRYVK